MRTRPWSFDGARGRTRLQVATAASMAARLRGLLGRPALGPDEGLLLAPCNLVHTVGMRYAIDVVFLRRDGTVLKVASALPPRRLSGHWRAHRVLELAAGTAARSGIVPGVRLPIDLLERP